MKSMIAKGWAVAALAGAFAFTPLAQAAGHGGGSHASGSHWSGGGASVSGDHHWGGGSRWSNPHWSGSRWSGGHWGYRGGWYARPSVGFYFGVPLFWGPWWDPYYPGYYYPGERVVYRELVADPMPIDAPQGASAGEATSAPAAPPANPMSANYCASARAYFPQVKACPEGWQQTSPTS